VKYTATCIPGGGVINTPIDDVTGAEVLLLNQAESLVLVLVDGLSCSDNKHTAGDEKGP
jgi:hypothetical protein